MRKAPETPSKGRLKGLCPQNGLFAQAAEIIFGVKGFFYFLSILGFNLNYLEMKMIALRALINGAVARLAL